MSVEKSQIIDAFKKTFGHSCAGSISVHCECGKIYYDSSVPGWFEEGEYEELEKNPNAIALDGSSGMFWFQGMQFAEACNCMGDNKTVKIYLNFLHQQKEPIIDFYNELLKIEMVAVQESQEILGRLKTSEDAEGK